MNYSALFKDFKKELFASIQYKHLGSPFKAFGFVAAIPFWIVYFAVMCTQYVTLFFFNCLASCSDYLEAWVKETKKDVNPITEAVLYLVTMPFIFFTRCLLSIFSIYFYMLWFFLMCVSYIASLGGIRWQPFITTAKFDNVKCTATTNKIAGNVISIIGFSLLCLCALLYLIFLMAESYDIYRVYMVFDAIYMLYMIIAIPITFKKAIAGVEASAAAKEETPVAAAPAVAAENKEDEDEFPEL